MIKTLKQNWKIYLIEAWALGLFMVSACLFTVLVEVPEFGLTNLVPSPFARRLLIGLAMGITAILLIHSNLGKKSGAHMNPAVTLANLQLDRISVPDAIYYMVAQCIGGLSGVLLCVWLLPAQISSGAVNYVVTVPGEGKNATAMAFLFEFLMSFFLFAMVLFLSNSPRLSRYSAYFVGLLLMLYIAFEAPYSGMSINPARTLASSIPSKIWDSFWVYLVAPVSGMLIAGSVYRKWYRKKNGECKSMACFMSGLNNGNKTYQVLKYYTNHFIKQKE